MTVRELIEKLQTLKPNVDILIKGENLLTISEKIEYAQPHKLSFRPEPKDFYVLKGIYDDSGRIN